MALAPNYGGGQGPRTQRLPQPGPGMLGPIADGVGQVGKAVFDADARLAEVDHRLEEIERQRRQSTEMSEHAAAIATEQGELQIKLNEIRRAPDFDPAAHPAQARKLIDETITNRLGAITDPEIYERLYPQLAQWGAAQNVAADVHSARSSAERKVVNHEAYRNQTANNLDADPANFSWAVVQSRTLAYGLGVPAEVAEKLWREDAAVYAQVTARARIRENPANGKALLLGGHFDEYLAPEAKQSLIDRAESEERRAEAAARAQISQAQAVVRSQVEMVRTRQSNGEVLPDEELMPVQQAAAAAALPKEEYDVAAIIIRNNVNRETRDYKPEDYDRRIGELQRLLPEKRSPDQSVELDQLLAIRDTRVKEYNDNPERRAARLGNPAPEFDWNDPASIARHTQWARGVAADTRRPPPILPEQEVLRLTELVGQGPSQRREAAELLMRLPDAGAIQAAVHKIAQDDEAFKIATRYSTLPGGVGLRRMRDALAGPEALKANPGIWSGTTAAGVSGQSEADRIFSEETAWSFRYLPEPYRAGVKETTKNLYATYAGRAGVTTFNEGLYRRALLDSIGAVGSGDRLTGGLARWGPGDDGPLIQVPVGMRPADMETIFYRSGPPEFRAAANGVPVHADGRPVRLGEIRRYMPVPLPDGTYALDTGHGLLPKEGGGVYKFDFNKLARQRGR